MTYALMLTPHPNQRYRASLEALALAELQICQEALALPVGAQVRELGGAPFLCFEAPELPPLAWREISRMSSVCLFAQMEGEALRPVAPVPRPSFFQEDLPALLKYKGKTNEAFTAMLLNLAFWNSAFLGEEVPLTVLDPMCGRGTGLLTALVRGWNAIGVELDKRDVKELNDYFARYLTFHHLKHQKKTGARTLAGRPAAPETVYTMAGDAQGMKAGETLSLQLLQGDVLAKGILPAKAAHLLICDLPYGIQHGPDSAHRTGKGGLEDLLREALTAWRGALRPGGAMALSFNAYTLRRDRLLELVAGAGWTPQTAGPYAQMEHWVEQAINRDVVVAKVSS